MKNKRSSRLIAWLLTLVMVLNMSPMTAVAETGSGLYTGPAYETVATLSSDPVPNEDVGTYTIQYVVKGEYTYTGEHMLLTDYTRQGTGKPSEAQPGTVTGCSTGNDCTWDAASKTLTFYPVPNTASIELRYMLVFKYKDGSYGIRTFQIMQNGEGELEEHEALEFKKFLNAINAGDGDKIVISKYNNVPIKQIFPFDLPSGYTTGIDNYTVTSFYNDTNAEGRDFTISYMGQGTTSGNGC